MGDLDPEEYLAFVGRVIAAFLDEAKKAYERIGELEAELAKFRFCTGWEVFIAGDGQKSIGRADCGMLGDHYHKEGE
jgi:hypothetical protein